MFQMILLQAADTAQLSREDLAWLLLLGVTVFVLTYWFRHERAARLAAERRAFEAERALLSAGETSEEDDEKAEGRNQQMFEQHRRMNQLTIAKLEAEIQLMHAQITQRATSEDRLEAGKEYHELMVEKTKLEMDSLRLHIAELRKRMEDWNSD